MASLVLLYIIASVSVVEVRSQDSNSLQETGINVQDVKDEKTESGSNPAVVLGVALSLAVIFAVAGIFIGIYFRVERVLCCCCKRCREEEDAEKLNRTPSTLQRQELTNSSNFYMTTAASTNQAFCGENTQCSEINADSSKHFDSSDKKLNDPKPQKHKRKPFFAPKYHKRRKNKGISLTSEEPLGFASSSTHIAEDGTLVRIMDKTDAKTLNKNQEESRLPSDIGHSYQTFSMQSDDILF